MIDILPNPYHLFDRWFAEAKAHPAINEPTAVALATADANGQPSCRIVLLKAYDERGFVFYTNQQTGRKSREIITNPHAALTFYWMPLEKQIRIEGAVERVSDAEADAYFASRARGSQIGAWASQQSTPLAQRRDFDDACAALEAEYEGRAVPRPPHWSGWRVIPQHIEFWQQRDYRRHDRLLYRREGEHWQTQWLYP